MFHSDTSEAMQEEQKGRPDILKLCHQAHCLSVCFQRQDNGCAPPVQYRVQYLYNILS